MLLKVLILFLLHGSHAQLLEFHIDYLGDEISVEEYKNSSLCLSKVCLQDVKQIMSYAPHKNISDLNLDSEDGFETFACGHFNEFKAPNDRYFMIGFRNELERQNQHYKKLMLKKKIHEDEPKIFKIMKSYFQKCVNSGEFCFNS